MLDCGVSWQVVKDLGGGHKECDTKRYVRIEKVGTYTLPNALPDVFC